MQYRIKPLGGVNNGISMVAGQAEKRLIGGEGSWGGRMQKGSWNGDVLLMNVVILYLHKQQLQAITSWKIKN